MSVDMTLQGFSINLSPNIDLKTLVKHISKQIGQNFPVSNFIRQELGGGVFYHAVVNGAVIAAYNHPTKNHSVTTAGPFGTNSSTANAGIWGVVYTSGFSPDLLKVYYKVY